MGFFNSLFEVSDEDIRFCIAFLMDRLMSLQSSTLNMPEIMIVSQYIPIRLAYQNGKSSLDLIDFIKSEDRHMEKMSSLPFSEIKTFRLNRITRFKEYEFDWEMILNRDTTGFFINARRNILGEESFSFNTYLPYNQIIAMSIGLAQEKIGSIKYESDNWISDFHRKLKNS